MKGVPFEYANSVLKAPPGTEEWVYDLHIFTDGQQVVSCGEGTWKERITFLITGKLWFHCVHRTHPPIAIQTEDPFK